VDKTIDCWLWRGSIDRNGYGRFRSHYAHRYAYELMTAKEIGPGLQIDHICHVRHCVNPNHLRRVTNKQNGENRAGLNSNNVSGVRGVYWHKRHQKWCAQFKHNRRDIYVGLFDDLKEAEAAITAKRREVYTCL
jgi:hypothetical protein